MKGGTGSTDTGSVYETNQSMQEDSNKSASLFNNITNLHHQSAHT